MNKLPLTNIIEFIRRFRLVLFLLLFTAIYVYLIMFISNLNSQEAVKAEVDAELQTVKRLRVDDEAVQQMLQLTEENIEIQTLYNDARNNPFSE